MKRLTTPAVRERIGEMYWRLKAYEDTGLTPEVCAKYKKFEEEIVSKGLTAVRIAELMDADVEGRIVILDEKPQHPCTRCDTGWGYVGTNGVHSCEETCERLKAYREAEEEKQ